MPNQCTAVGPSILLRDGMVPGTAMASNRQPDLIAPSDTLASAKLARAIIKARAARRHLFDEHLFSDPAWDMLLELYALKCEAVRVSVSKLSVAANVPGTTALRWIDKLEEQGLVERSDDPLDGRRVWIVISDQGFETMWLYLEQIPMRHCAI